jgi:hypothetical protein
VWIVRRRPAAVLNLASGSKILKLHVSDAKHVIVIAAPAFSCAWANQRVAVNYRETGDEQGEVMSVELQ